MTGVSLRRKEWSCRQPRTIGKGEGHGKDAGRAGRGYVDGTGDGMRVGGAVYACSTPRLGTTNTCSLTPDYFGVL